MNALNPIYDGSTNINMPSFNNYAFVKRQSSNKQNY